jgi:hypothetical protein
MEKKQKMLLIGGGVALAGIVAVYLISKKNTGVVSSNTSMSTNGVCPQGMVPCSTDKNKCYNPTANYVLDPCATPSSQQSPISTQNPVVQIIDGVIKLFKKPAKA